MPSIIPPSPWVVRYSEQLPKRGRVLDFACGHGRHTRWLAANGFAVLAVDRDFEAISGLQGIAGVMTQCADLEGDVWPLAGNCFGGIVVTNYLWRPRLSDLLSLLEPGGVLIYETFMVGNEAYGKPSNPAFLLRPGELREVVRAAGLREIAYQEGFVPAPKPAVCQAICAARE